MDKTILPVYQLLHELESQFHQLLTHIDQAASLYEQLNAATWQFEPSTDIAWLRDALLDMWHRDGQDGRETSNYTALIVADEPLLNAFQAINSVKSKISEILRSIKRLNPAVVSEIKQHLPNQHPKVNQVLRKTGYARLHLKQCWRHIPIAPAPVSRVRFAWYNSGRSIKKVTVQDVFERLSRLDTDSEHIRIQLSKLASIPSSEVLAQVQTQAPVLRANLFFSEPLNDGRTRQAMNVALPLIVPSCCQQLPDIKMPALKAPSQRTRAKRSDEKLEAQVFLPSLRIYRYR